jgi:hypothetical protein
MEEKAASDHDALFSGTGVEGGNLYTHYGLSQFLGLLRGSAGSWWWSAVPTLHPQVV